MKDKIMEVVDEFDKPAREAIIEKVKKNKFR